MVMLRYTPLVLLVLLGGFLACEGEKDPAVSTTELGDGIAVLDEGEARDAIEALKNPNEVFKPGQTRFLTADPFQTPGALPSSMWEKGYDQNGILSPTSGNAQGRGDLAEESASLDDADFNGDGILTVREAALGSIADGVMGSLEDWSAWGQPSHVRFGLDYTF